MGKHCEYNPLMEAKWVFVSIGNPSGETYSSQRYEQMKIRREEIELWCNENTHGRWSIRPGYYGTSLYAFKGKRDALLFKLTWGGV